MIELFVFEQLHFALHLFAAIVWFFAAWLYFDAWIVKKAPRELLRWIGFGALAVSFAVEAAVVEGNTVSSSFLLSLIGYYPVIRVAGYLAIIASLLMDPLPRRISRKALPVMVMGVTDVSLRATIIGLPLGALFTAVLYLRRSVQGLEHHLFPVAVSFIVLTVAEAAELSVFLRQSSDVFLYQLAAPYGPLWIVHQVCLVAATLVLGKWVLWYLLKRFETQLFMFVTLTVVTIYLVTTATFTTVLMQAISQNNLKQLDANVRVLSFGVSRRQEELLADTVAQAKRADVGTAVQNQERSTLTAFATQLLETNQRSTVVVLDEHSQVLARGEDAERFGDVLTDPLITLALDGNALTSVMTIDDVLGASLILRAAAPIVVDGERRGVLLVGSRIDSAFLDGFKQTTGLEGTVFAGDKISATTLVLSDGVSRPVGITIPEVPAIQSRLQNGSSFSDTITLANVRYLGAFYPLTDHNHKAVGMYFVGKPETELLDTATQSLRLTFGMAIVLLAVSLVPAYLMARSLSKQARS